VERTLEVLRRRVDQLGVTEPSLQRSGDRRVIVELPGVTDPQQALDVIGRTAQLTFHRVLGLARDRQANGGGDRQGAGDSGGDRAGEDRAAGEGEEGQSADERDLVLEDEDGVPLRLGPPRLTGDVVGDSEAVPDPNLGVAWSVSMSFRGDGGERWAEVTGEAACEPVQSPQRRVAIVLDRQIISSPQVDPQVECDVGITGGDTEITGDFTQEEAQDLALLIRAGALPVPVDVVERRTIGPTLGDEAIRASVQAAVIGAGLTILYVIAYYRLLGVLAVLALLAYGVISYAALLALRATLTLPGIAGFVLAIGMAVDANVLVFERSKEEFTRGRTLRSSLVEGFRKAWSAILDSNVTTVIAAVILFYFASGAVRGFGVTLTVGVLASMFTALVITRVMAEASVRSPRAASNPGLFGINVGGRLRARLSERPVDVIARSKLWFALSLAVLALAAAGLVTRGLNYGLEFTGGRLIEYSVSEPPPDLNRVRSALADAGFPRAVVQESSGGNLTVRTAELSRSEEATLQSAVERVTGSVEQVRDEFVGPTIGDELRTRALIALSLGLGAQLLYLAFRFRWTFGASAVMALAHDVVVLLGIFAWLGKNVDGVFVAALLTTIGYSINDSVVVFDRIREQRRARAREPLATVANDACMQTIPRTINTGLGALFILLALYFLGGETLTDFALALIIGIVIGTYSSVFTAAPLVVLFEGLSPTQHVAPVESTREAALRKVREQPASADARPASDRGPAPARPARPRAGAAKRKRRRR
jgi:SecD/SecF fusion protein